MKLENFVKTEKNRELLIFLFLTVLLAPIITVIVVGGFGFAVWIMQMMTGPPGT
jgi:nitrate reductase NapE